MYSLSKILYTWGLCWATVVKHAFQAQPIRKCTNSYFRQIKVYTLQLYKVDLKKIIQSVGNHFLCYTFWVLDRWGCSWSGGYSRTSKLTFHLPRNVVLKILIQRRAIVEKQTGAQTIAVPLATIMNGTLVPTVHFIGCFDSVKYLSLK